MLHSCPERDIRWIDLAVFELLHRARVILAKRDAHMASNNRTDDKPQQAGVTTSFPYDRRIVERFMKAFPRARWNDEQKAWFVPGKTAAQRIDRWFAQEAPDQDAYGDQKGRDAFEFDPIRSPYLEPVDTDLRVRTPYSRTVVEELRAIPWAQWDEDLRVWHVPYRSYEELRRRWHAIEQAAHRNEPAARKRRQQERRNTDAGRAARMRSAERRRRRYPVSPEGLPPLGVPVSTHAYGIVVFTDITGELAEAEVLSAFYPHTDDRGMVWASLRNPKLDELVATWPARTDPGSDERRRGWWQPTIGELRPARRAARRKRMPDFVGRRGAFRQDPMR
jgi:hypothetical protein